MDLTGSCGKCGKEHTKSARSGVSQVSLVCSCGQIVRLTAARLPAAAGAQPTAQPLTREHQTAPPIQDQFVDRCFHFDIVELDEHRNWRFPEAREMVKARDEGRTDDAIRYAHLLKARYQDFFFPYFTAARMYARQRRFEEARVCLQEGLKFSRSKFYLCAQMGDLEWELGNLPEAVQWWIRSIVIQIRESKLEWDDPFLKLSYVAGQLGLAAVNATLLRYVDRLTPGQQRLSPEYVTRIYEETRRCASESMRQALLILDKELDSCDLVSDPKGV